MYGDTFRMKKRQRQTKATTRDKSVGKGTEPRKTYSLRKRKCECGQDINSTEALNVKKRRVQTGNSDQRTDRKVTSSAEKRERHAKDIGQGEARLQDVSVKESLKRKRGKKSEECARSEVGFKTKIAKRVLRSSMKYTKDRNEKVNKQPYSKQRLGLKKNGDKKRGVQRRNLSEKFKIQSTQKNTTKSIVRASVHNRKPISKKEEQSRPNSRLNSKAESYKKSKAKTNNQILPKNKRIRKQVQKVQNTVPDVKSAKTFSNFFLKKITVKNHHTIHEKGENIHGISVSDDNLVWVNHLINTVHLRHTTGKMIRSFKLDFRPVFNCCTPSGDILVTQGYSVNCKPTISLISREGDVKELADLSSYASNLCGILCQDERIYVVAFMALNKNYFVIKLNLNGEVEHVYHTQKASENINQIISINGQIAALRTNSDGFMPLEADHISSRKMNKISITLYSASASVDKFGNVIMGSNASIFIINPGLEYMHEIPTGTSEEIISTAVDQQNQLWFGTRSGKLYSTKYLK